MLSLGDLALLAIPLVFLALTWLVVGLTEPPDARGLGAPPPRPEAGAAEEPSGVVGGEMVGNSPAGSSPSVSSRPPRAAGTPQSRQKSGGRQ